jgi:anhydro-N-acetylmuramic acid kinase
MFTIGVMTGTSMDGIDACLVDLSSSTPVRIASVHERMPEHLREQLSRIQTSQWEPDPLLQIAVASRALMKAMAPVVEQLKGESPAPVRAVGIHGQTVRHWPDQGLSLQLAAPAVLAELLGLDVVHDFRSRDLAAGGQGAPLVPPFHAALLSGRHVGAVGVLNLGGIANLSVMDGDTVRGFDTGPANTLMDLWSQKHRQQPFDEAGAWAASATPDAALLHQLLSDRFFQTVGPKSTGRDDFSLNWLEAHLKQHTQALEPVVVQATLLELTVQSVLQQIPRNLEALYLCGGGVHNTALVHRLTERVRAWNCDVLTTDAIGWPTDDIEAGAFAWLTGQCLLRRPGNHPGVTGARGPRVLGSITPALVRTDA